MSFLIRFTTSTILSQIDKEGRSRLLHRAISNALRITVLQSNIFARAIVPERTGLLLESGIHFLRASLNSATAGVNLRSFYELELAWPVSYARYVSLLPQSTTKWTKGGSRSDYQIQIFDFILHNFRLQLALALIKLQNLRN